MDICFWLSFMFLLDFKNAFDKGRSNQPTPLLNRSIIIKKMVNWFKIKCL